jgi:hypothetical protein
MFKAESSKKKRAENRGQKTDDRGQMIEVR